MTAVAELNRWHLITGEYPPQHGGVGDYSRLVANGLANGGDAVHIYAPPSSDHDLNERGIQVSRLSGHFDPRSLRELGNLLRGHGDDLVLVQYVPHAYGYKAMNLPFCLWLNALRRTHRRMIVMFHEVSMPFRRAQPMSHRLQALVTSPMAMLMARAASTIFVSIPAWKDRLIRFHVRKPVMWLPVPSNVPVVEDVAAITALRRRLRAELVIGHFGTCEADIGNALELASARLLTAFPAASFLLIGGDGIAMKRRLSVAQPGLASRVHAPGRQSSEDLSIALSACDLMVQPYAEGVSSRRGSVMAALAHRRAVITSAGDYTEPFWSESGAVAIAPAGDDEAFYQVLHRLAADAIERDKVATAGRRLYDERFALPHTLAALHQSACASL